MPWEIYLNNSATTRTDPEVASYIADVMVNQCAATPLPSTGGADGPAGMGKGLKRIAAVLGCDPGASPSPPAELEADNLAIFGGAQAKSAGGNKIVTTAFEHAAVLAPSASWKNRGFQAV